MHSQFDCSNGLIIFFSSSFSQQFSKADECLTADDLFVSSFSQDFKFQIKGLEMQQLFQFLPSLTDLNYHYHWSMMEEKRLIAS